MGARLTISALRSSGVECAGLDLSDAFRAREIEAYPSEPTPDRAGALLVHVNAPYLPFAAMQLGARVVQGPRVIGYWAWELPKLPADWKLGFNFVHEVWVPSHFVAEAVRSRYRGPVRVVPHPVACAALGDPSPSDRARFGLPEDAFVCLCACDIASGGAARKNPLAAIRAFRRAFGDDPRRILVVKTSHSSHSPSAALHLESVVAGMSNVRLLSGLFDTVDLHALFGSVDALISLHRSEGFGLILAEAMIRGLAVVATGWSGNLEYMNSENSALIPYKLVPAVDPSGVYDIGAEWAEPDVDAATAWLRRLAEDAELRHQIGCRAAADARRLLGADALALAVATLSAGV
jgi:glycosyltransferase involved in cell wall biosynthesis